MRTVQAFSTAWGHSSGCRADKTKIMIATSAEPGSTDDGKPSFDERSQTCAWQCAGSNAGFFYTGQSVFM